ncbi:hypothetical protein SteCoe_37554 [Stentor coeruleus]|uniref:Cache domain-containing protein n=1 Tax=Stentor coeruleus TaxID=5963 RepID=A0A1R2AN23_9CILI|nr:hypothetical protein SteCoe_37554 [Stentor coeruleus]
MFLLIFICVPSLIAETKGLLDWIDIYLTKNNADITNNQTKDFILHLLSLNSYALTSELRKYFKTTELMVNLLPKLNSAYLISSNTDAVISNSIKNPNIVYEDFGVFYSKYYPELSEQGLEIINSSKAMDLIFPNIRQESIMWMYFGFEIDEIFYIYPGVVMPSGYTHIIREWYYQAIVNKGKITLTEPYIDAVKKIYVITASKTVEQDGKIYAVAAIDLTCDYMKQLVNIKTESKELIVILSTIKGAMIVNPWNYNLEIRLFQEDITGFSESLWEKITGPQFYDNTSFEFSTVGQINYLCYRRMINPYNEFTHVLIICIDKSNLQDHTDKKGISFYKSYSKIFYGVIITLFSASFLNVLVNLYFSSKLVKSLISIHDYIKKLITVALMKSFDYQMLKFPSKNDFISIDSIFECFNARIDNIQSLERIFANYNWHSSRPSEDLLYKNWSTSFFPMNTIGFKVKKIRYLFVQCTNITKRRSRRSVTYTANGLANCDMLSLVNEASKLERLTLIKKNIEM